MKKMFLKPLMAVLGLCVMAGTGTPILANSAVDEGMPPEMEHPEKNPPQEGGHTIFRFYNRINGDHLYTDAANRAEMESLEQKGSPWSQESCWCSPPTGEPIFRLCNPNSGEHLYTASENERDTLQKAGWRDEGVAFHSNTPDKDPVYRVFNPNARNAGSHLYTRSTDELNALVRLGWKDEGIVWYVTMYADPNVGAA